MSNTLKPVAPSLPALPASWDIVPWNHQRSILEAQRPMKRVSRFFGRRQPTLFHRCLAVHIISASQTGALQ